MPTVSQRWPIHDLIQHYAGVDIKSQGTVTGVFEYRSNCPFCPTSRDSFIMQPETGWWSHSIRNGGCGRHGDAKDFLEQYCHMSPHEAIVELEWQDMAFAGSQEAHTSKEMAGVHAPDAQWRASAMAFWERAERYLWSGRPDATNALWYLHHRGLNDETIRAAHLGYVPLQRDGLWFHVPFESWGLDASKYPGDDELKIPNGILFPYFVGGEIWKLELRRGDKKLPKMVVAGSEPSLYGIDDVVYGDIVMMVEGPLDRLAVLQESREFKNFSCVATGGSGECRRQRWIAELMKAAFVLQSFDEDTSGDDGAGEWMKIFNSSIDLLSKMERWSPILWNDPDNLLMMEKAGETVDKETGEVFRLRDWIELGIDTAKTEMRIQSHCDVDMAKTVDAVTDRFSVGEEVRA